MKCARIFNISTNKFIQYHHHIIHTHILHTKKENHNNINNDKHNTKPVNFFFSYKMRLTSLHSLKTDSVYMRLSWFGTWVAKLFPLNYNSELLDETHTESIHYITWQRENETQKQQIQQQRKHTQKKTANLEETFYSKQFAVPN